MNSVNTTIELLAWAATLEIGVLRDGRGLAHWQVADARQVGVRCPDRVRLLLVDAIPTTRDPDLRAATENSGVLDGSSGYLTLGYAIMIHRRHLGSRRILRRALGAVAEVELAGSLQAYLFSHLNPMLRADIPTSSPANDQPMDAQVAYHRG